MYYNLYIFILYAILLDPSHSHSLPLSIITLMRFAKVVSLEVDIGGSVGVKVPGDQKRCCMMYTIPGAYGEVRDV